MFLLIALMALFFVIWFSILLFQVIKMIRETFGKDDDNLPPGAALG